MCGGAPLAGVEVPAVTQKVMEVTMWPEKKKSQWGGGGGRHFTGHGGRRGLRLDNDEEDFEADFEKFEANSRDYDLELRLGRVAEKDDDDEVVEIKPFAAIKRSLSQGTMPTASFDGPSERPTKRKRKNQFRGIRPAGSADFASNKPLVPAMNFAAPVEAPFMHMYSDQGSNSFGSSDTKTPDISSIAPIFAITDEAESALVKSNTYNSVVPPVIENNAVNLEPWMRYLMDDGVDELIDSLLNFDVPQDVIENMDLWSFDDMPICGEFF